MDPRYPQLRKFVVQTVQNRKIHYGAFDEMDARRQAEAAGHRITRIIEIEDFQKHIDSYYLGYADGMEFGRQLGFELGYKHAMTLAQREEEELENLGSRMINGTLFEIRKDS